MSFCMNLSIPTLAEIDLLVSWNELLSDGSARFHEMECNSTIGAPLRTKRSGVRIPCSAPRKRSDSAGIASFLFYLQGIRKPVKKTLRGSVFRASSCSVPAYITSNRMSSTARNLPTLHPCSVQFQYPNFHCLVIKTLKSAFWATKKSVSLFKWFAHFLSVKPRI